MVPPLKPVPQPENICRVCGATVPLGRSFCSECDMLQPPASEWWRLPRLDALPVTLRGRKLAGQRRNGDTHSRNRNGNHPVSPVGSTKKLTPAEFNHSTVIVWNCKPSHYVGAGRISHVCRCDPCGQTPTASTALAGSGETGWRSDLPPTFVHLRIRQCFSVPWAEPEWRSARSQGRRLRVL